MDYFDFILRSKGKDGNLAEITILELHKIMFLFIYFVLYNFKI